MCFGGGGDSGGGGGNDNDSNDSNSFTETLANIFTPNDGASYVGGQLVDDNTGASISAGGTTSTGNVISGIANTTSNDDDNRPAPAPIKATKPVKATKPAAATTTGALPAATTPLPKTTEGVSNSARENFANLLTPFDGASYVNGQLVDDETGASLTGGGYSSTGDYIYGVSDDSSNNVLDTTGMDSDEISIATAKQQMTEDIPPGDLAYFASFLPGMISPMFGGYLGEQMLKGGIEDRKSIIDQQVAALEMGATPQFDAQGNYIGFDNSTMSTFGQQVLGADDIMAFMPPGPNNPAYDPDANKDGVNDFDRFRTVFDAQSAAADADPYGMSTEGGFITSDGDEYYIQGDGSVDMITNNLVPYDDAASGSTVNQVYGIDDVNLSSAIQSGDNGRRSIYGTRGTSSDYDRFSRGGGGYAFMPAYMRQFMTGENFDVMAEQITLADGSTAYRTPDGRILSPEQFQNTARYENALTVEGPDEQYLQGYQDTDAAGMPVYFDAEGNPVGSLE
jgi:hypothetical protein